MSEPSSDAGGFALDLRRLYDAPAERVFDAWLSEEWATFLGPHAVTADILLLEPRVGGRYRIAMHLPEGRDLIVGGTYREIARPARLAFTWKWEHEAADTLVILTFRSIGAQTELHLRHERFESAERRDSHNQGWPSILEKLDQRLKAGGP